MFEVGKKYEYIGEVEYFATSNPYIVIAKHKDKAWLVDKDGDCVTEQYDSDWQPYTHKSSDILEVGKWYEMTLGNGTVRVSTVREFVGNSFVLGPSGLPWNLNEFRSIKEAELIIGKTVWENK